MSLLVGSLERLSGNSRSEWLELAYTNGVGPMRDLVPHVASVVSGVSVHTGPADHPFKLDHVVVVVRVIPVVEVVGDVGVGDLAVVVVVVVRSIEVQFVVDVDIVVQAPERLEFLVPAMCCVECQAGPKILGLSFL